MYLTHLHRAYHLLEGMIKTMMMMMIGEGTRSTTRCAIPDSLQAWAAAGEVTTCLPSDPTHYACLDPAEGLICSEEAHSWDLDNSSGSAKTTSEEEEQEEGVATCPARVLVPWVPGGPTLHVDWAEGHDLIRMDHSLAWVGQIMIT